MRRQQTVQPSSCPLLPADRLLTRRTHPEAISLTLSVSVPAHSLNLHSAASPVSVSSAVHTLLFSLGCPLLFLLSASMDVSHRSLRSSRQAASSTAAAAVGEGNSDVEMEEASERITTAHDESTDDDEERQSVLVGVRLVTRRSLTLTMDGQPAGQPLTLPPIVRLKRTAILSALDARGSRQVEQSELDEQQVAEEREEDDEGEQANEDDEMQQEEEDEGEEAEEEAEEEEEEDEQQQAEEDEEEGEEEEDDEAVDAEGDLLDVADDVVDEQPEEYQSAGSAPGNQQHSRLTQRQRAMYAFDSAGVSAHLMSLPALKPKSDKQRYVDMDEEGRAKWRAKEDKRRQQQEEEKTNVINKLLARGDTQTEGDDGRRQRQQQPTQQQQQDGEDSHPHTLVKYVRRVEDGKYCAYVSFPAADVLILPAFISQPAQPAPPATRPLCAALTCNSTRRYVDKASGLSVCSLACLTQCRVSALPAAAAVVR